MTFRVIGVGHKKLLTCRDQTSSFCGRCNTKFQRRRDDVVLTLCAYRDRFYLSSHFQHTLKTPSQEQDYALQWLFLKAPITTAADEIYKYFFHCFLEKIRFDVLSESSPKQRLHMKIQAYFLPKIKVKNKNVFSCNFRLAL